MCTKSSALYHRQVAVPSPWDNRGMVVLQTGPVKLSDQPSRWMTNKDRHIRATLPRPTGWLEKKLIANERERTNVYVDDGGIGMTSRVVVAMLIVVGGDDVMAVAAAAGESSLPPSFLIFCFMCTLLWRFFSSLRANLRPQTSH